jgi:hypothetical protein
MEPTTNTSAPAPEDDTITPEQLEELRAQEVAFSWQAAEYVHHQKSIWWYLGLAGVVVVLVVVAVWLKYWLEVGLFLVMGTAIMIYARKPPRVLLYELTQSGIKIDGRDFLYKDLRSFSVIPDESWHTIDLDPVKRLSPRVAILFDERDFDDIVGHLRLHLPEIDRGPDLIERLTRPGRANRLSLMRVFSV